MICVDHLSFSYGDRNVLDGLSFSLADGGFTALLGCNGAGKTTLFRCLLGLLPKYSGNILIDGKDLREYSPKTLARKIAYIPQSYYPAFNYSVLDMVLMGTTQQLSLMSKPGQKQVSLSLEALERLGIARLAERSFARLSGGERQLVLIARALAQQAGLLLMDEPCASLDFGNQCRVMEVMRVLSAEGYTVLMSTHQPQHVLTYCDRVIALADGCLLADGAPDETVDSLLIRRLYGVDAAFAETAYGKVVLPVDPVKSKQNVFPKNSEKLFSNSEGK